jgi:hypothetical protein
LRDSSQTAFETNSKYNTMRDLQERNKKGVGLMPGAERPVLPALDEYVKTPPAQSTTPPENDQ